MDSNLGDDAEELAQGKTIFFMGRNQDSPNLFHGISEFINAFSLMILYKLPASIDISFVFLNVLLRLFDALPRISTPRFRRENEPEYIFWAESQAIVMECFAINLANFIIMG